MPDTDQESERSFMYVLGVSIFPLSMIFLLDFEPVQLCQCFVFHFVDYI